MVIITHTSACLATNKATHFEVLVTSFLISINYASSGVVTCIKIRANNLECVSASDDGTCIIWDLNRFVRNQIIFANTLFKAVCYQPDETQLLSGGSDRKVIISRLSKSPDVRN